jgi:predicted O-methyltransferase YrrM
MAGVLDKIMQELAWTVYRLHTKLLRLNDPRGSFHGKLSRKEGITLFKLVQRLPGDALIVEIGCYCGLSSAYLLEGAKTNGSCLFSIDPFDFYIEYQQKDESNLQLFKQKLSQREVENALEGFGLNNFKLIRGFSFEVVKKWEKPINLLWIDGNHDYEAVKRDYHDWEPFLKVDGIIVFHDSNKKDNSGGWSKWGFKGPTKLVDEVLCSPKWYGVKKVESITYARKSY